MKLENKNERQARSVNISGFSCELFSHALNSEDIRKVVVLLHGYCGTGTGLGKSISSLVGADFGKDMAVIFPQAKIIIDNDKWAKPGDTAWWKHTRERLDEFEYKGRPLLEKEEEIPGLANSALALMPFFLEITQRHFPNCDKLTVGGFSMGAILATEIALNSGLDIALLGVFSGTLTRSGFWTEAMKSYKKLTVVQNHGRKDPILEINQARELSTVFRKYGHTVFYYETDDGHFLQKEPLLMFFKLVNDSALSGAAPGPRPNGFSRRPGNSN
jgi:predicted esterase